MRFVVDAQLPPALARWLTNESKLLNLHPFMVRQVHHERVD